MHKQSKPVRRGVRRGMMLAYIVVALLTLIGICSLAVDVGRVHVAKSQLRVAADAAARAGTNALSSGVTAAQNAAVAVAAANTADGSAVSIDSTNDIEFGTWDPSARTFTVLTGAARSTANSIRVTARRTAARGNPIPLLLAQVIGRSTCDVTVVATASASTPTGYGAVGLDYINMGGNSTDSYWSTSGATLANYGSIASNGDITLSGSSSIHGGAHPGIGKTVIGATHVSGSTTPLTTALSYPNASAGTYAYINNNDQVPSSAMSSSSFGLGGNKSITLPGGNYYFNNFNLGANASVTFTGPATLYIYGSFTLSGQAVTNGTTPGNLTIKMVPSTSGTAPGSINLGSGSDLYATIYAPQSALTMSGSGDLYGSVVAKSIDMTGSSAIHYDLVLDGGMNGLSLVK